MSSEEVEDMLRQIDSVPERKPNVNLQFMDNPALFHSLSQYRRNLGWTWKRMFLVGMGNTLIKNGDNPDLALEIADYLEGKR